MEQFASNCMSKEKQEPSPGAPVTVEELETFASQLLHNERKRLQGVLQQAEAREFPLTTSPSQANHVVLTVDSGDVTTAIKAWNMRKPSVGADASELELLFAFLGGVVQLFERNYTSDASQTTRSRSASLADASLAARFHHPRLPSGSVRVLLKMLIVELGQKLNLESSDIHVLLDGQRHISDMVWAYHNALAVLHGADLALHEGPLEVEGPAMLHTSSNGLFVVFGGQGLDWLPELRSTFHTYPAVRRLIVNAASAVQRQHELVDAQLLRLYPHGFDLLRWIVEEESTPVSDYLASAPISYPMVCLTQLVNYYNYLRLTHVSPKDFRDRLKGTTGHSQGIVAAVVLAAADTNQDLERMTIHAVEYLFWHGARTAQVCPARVLSPTVLKEAEEFQTGRPSPMLSVNGLNIATLEKILSQVNRGLPGKRQARVSLYNGINAAVVSGDPRTLHTLHAVLRKVRIEEGQSQARIPFSQRKPSFSMRYLPVSVPFHSPLLTPAQALILSDLNRLGLKAPSSRLHIPVYSTYDGKNLQQSESEDIMALLVELQCVQPVRWMSACNVLTQENSGVTHVIDFGPGRTMGIGRLVQRFVDGRGIQVILGGSLQGDETLKLANKASMLDLRSEKLPKAVSWREAFGPKLVKRTDTGEVVLETRFTKIFGKPPVIVPGMTPTTVPVDFCAAITSAGYHVELAGGGLFNREVATIAVQDLTKLLQPGQNLTWNMLYLNPRQWAFQFPLALELRSKGYPIESITVAAGVPTPDKADEIIAQMLRVGMDKIAFKPGSVAAIREVAEIAGRNRAMTVVLQWTGGQAGGHHSCENQYEPMLDTYSALRTHDNLVLIAGGGIGSAQNALVWIDGSWSTRFGRPAMPFDAVLIGSRVMVAEEAHTERAVKELIVKAPGVPNDGMTWEKTFTGEQGGVITVQSELGEPIHKVANRSMKMWHQFDHKLFSLSREALKEKLKEPGMVEWVVKELNDNYQKPFFGKKKNGTVVYHVSDMTYMEVVHRMAELMCPDESWVHESYRSRFHMFVRRTMERFTSDTSQSAPVLQSQDVTAVINALEEYFPQASVALLSPEDDDFFHHLCLMRGKPMNFVPYIDEHLHFWVKKDSLWYSENMSSVPQRDPERVVVLQGPVAVSGSTKVDEPVSEILDGINHGMIELLSKREDCSAPAPLKHTPSQDDLTRFLVEAPYLTDGHVALQMAVPREGEVDSDAWLLVLGGEEGSWRHSLLHVPHIVRDNGMCVDNVVRGLFLPRPGQRVQLMSSCGQTGEIDRIRLFHHSVARHIGLQSDVPMVEVVFDPSSGTIDVTLCHTSHTGKPVSVVLQFVFHHEFHSNRGHSHCVIEEEAWERRCSKLCDFYSSLWLDSAQSNVVCTPNSIRMFKAAIEDPILDFDDEAPLEIGQERAPVDYGMSVCWNALMEALLDAVGSSGACDLLSLVHLSNEFIVHDAPTPRPSVLHEVIVSGRGMEVSAVCEGIWDEDSMRVFSVRARITSSDRVALEIVSRFAIREQGFISRPSDNAFLFDTQHHDFSLPLSSDAAVAVLQSKGWHAIPDGVVGEGDELQVHVKVTKRPLSKTDFSFDTHGEVFRSGKSLGKVQHAHSAAKQCPVLAYLQRHGERLTHRHLDSAKPLPAVRFYEPVEFPAPSARNTRGYAMASKDVNPIHTNQYFVPLAGLPSCIVHGMHSSAKGRQVIERVANGRVKRYEARFVGMVQSGEQLLCETRHVGMSGGLKIVDLVMREAKSQAVVLKAEAEVSQSVTSYVFTGQGSAVMGMGMELYQQSDVSRSVWDAADTFFMTTYGFSILHIVRTNPKKLRVQFEGPNAKRMRENYANLHSMSDSGPIPIFPEAQKPSCTGITFRSAGDGLLFSTQFQQPAILLTEKAQFEDMVQKGVVQRGCRFAGHSLGEYGALACILEGSVEAIAQIVFLRGLTMQSVVKRDSKGRSRYGMVAASPMRAAVDEDTFFEVVRALEQGVDQLLQVVNYNIRGQQYVVAGGLCALEALRISMNAMYANRKSQLEFDQSLLAHSIEEAKQLQLAADAQDDGFMKLQRGKATIPLPGIDVPFHSRILRPGVSAFRHILSKNVDSWFGADFDTQVLVDRYIPNLVGTPFRLDKAFVQLTANKSESPVLMSIVKQWEEGREPDKDTLCRTLVVELLAYQFASPVLWIDTQDVFVQAGVERFIEVGPQAVLLPFLAKSFPNSGLQLLATSNAAHLDIIYCLEEGMGEEEYDAVYSEPASEESDEVVVEVVEAAAAVSAVVAAPTSASPAPTSEPVNVPVSVEHAIRVLVAHKLKVDISEAPADKSINQLSGGKSAVQNEVMGDLGVEFKTEPEGAEKLPIRDVAAAVSDKVSYGKPGKVLGTLMNKHYSQLLPGGFALSKARAYLQSTWNAGAGAVDNVLLHGLRKSLTPTTRMANVAEAKQWLDKTAASTAQELSLPLAKVTASAAQASGGGAQVQVVDSKQLDAIKDILRKQRIALSSLDVLEESVADDVLESTQRDWDMLERELGAKFLDGIAPSFDPLLVRRYDSWWNWARNAAFELFSKGADVSEEQEYLLCNRAHPSLVQLLYALAHTEEHKQLARKVEEHVSSQALYKEFRQPSQPLTTVHDDGEVVAHSTPRYEDGFTGFVEDVFEASRDTAIRLKHAVASSVDGEQRLSGVFKESLSSLVNNGISFSGKTALITGCGQGSIGVEVARVLLMGGCRVVVTTSRPTRRRWDMFRRVYKESAGKDAQLIVVPFNAASFQDVKDVVKHLVDAKGLNVGIPDLFLPFAAIPEQGRDISNIDDLSELAHRAMLVNVVRMLGEFRSHLELHSGSHMHVVLPMSPNHGLFGGDGLYAESKLSLETLFHKWRSEEWGGSITLVGAEIGWTRGTGLMNANDLISEDIEQQCGLRTFDTTEMAVMISTLCSAAIVSEAKQAPLKADLSGGFHSLGEGEGLPAGRLRAELQKRSSELSIVTADHEQDRMDTTGIATHDTPAEVTGRANLDIVFPTLPTEASLSRLPQLEGMIDLDKTVVVVGYGEVGPWGSARTRWEWEVAGKFTKEGAIELARSMGLIRYNEKALTESGAAWVDANSGEAVQDHEVATRYWDTFMEHAGIRPVEPELFRGYDPSRKMLLSQVALEADMEPFEVSSLSEVEHFRKEHGTRLQVQQHGDVFRVSLKKGAVVYLPKRVPFSRTVAGQIPTGWDPEAYGIPKDIANAVDPVSSFALAATMDAFASAGIQDPYELYQHVHVSQVGNSSGGGMGGMKSFRQIFRDRLLEATDVSSDTLQETFINTTAAWVNMLLLSSCGPIKTPVAACATAAVSVELAVETIKSGKAKFMVCGGYEDFGEEGSFEFAQMKATSDGLLEAAKRREPNEMCRPATSTRAGFMESQGSGIQLVCTAKLALDMGLPVYAIVAAAHTATDREGRSVPAPGQGILSTAREVALHATGTAQPFTHPLLDLDYRRQELKREVDFVHQWLQEQLQKCPETSAVHREFLHSEARRRMKALQRVWGMDFFEEDHHISPLRGALAVWGLTPDDIQVCSFHGTSTKANDSNESDVVNQQMRHLGRTPGVPLCTVWQKWLTGHPKGAAAAWMFNGMLQCMNSSIVPGNRNLDNVDSAFVQYEHLLFLDQSIQLPSPPLATYLHSFGFGQAGAEVLLVHANLVLAAIPSLTLQNYSRRRHMRQQRASQHFQKAMCNKIPLVKIKNRAPYDLRESEKRAGVKKKEVARSTYLDPTKRAVFDAHTREWCHPFHEKSAVRSRSQTVDVSQGPGYLSAILESTRESTRLQNVLGGLGSTRGSGNSFLGVDVEEIATFENKDDVFFQRNFTDSERKYCERAPHPMASYAGRWCAKEAVVKALSACGSGSENLFGAGPGAPLKDIEVVMSASGAPTVRLSGRAEEVAQRLRIGHVSVSISHTGQHAAANAIVTHSQSKE